MIRQFKNADESHTANIWLKSGQDEYAYLPQFQALDGEKALKVFHNAIANECEIWLETNDPSIRGFIALQGSYIDRLYIEP